MKKIVFFCCFLFLCWFSPVFAHDKTCHEPSSATNPSCQPNFTKPISTKGLSKMEQTKVLGYETGKEHASQNLPPILSVDSNETYRTLYNEYYNKGYQEGSLQTSNKIEQKEATYYIKKGYDDAKKHIHSSSSSVPESYVRFYKEGYKRGQEESKMMNKSSPKKVSSLYPLSIFIFLVLGFPILFVLFTQKRKKKN